MQRGNNTLTQSTVSLPYSFSSTSVNSLCESEAGRSGMMTASQIYLSPAPSKDLTSLSKSLCTLEVTASLLCRMSLCFPVSMSIRQVIVSPRKGRHAELLAILACDTHGRGTFSFCAERLTQFPQRLCLTPSCTRHRFHFVPERYLR